MHGSKGWLIARDAVQGAAGINMLCACVGRRLGCLSLTVVDVRISLGAAAAPASKPSLCPLLSGCGACGHGATAVRRPPSAPPLTPITIPPRSQTVAHARMEQQLYGGSTRQRDGSGADAAVVLVKPAPSAASSSGVGGGSRCASASSAAGGGASSSSNSVGSMGGSRSGSASDRKHKGKGETRARLGFIGRGPCVHAAMPALLVIDLLSCHTSLTHAWCRL